MVNKETRLHDTKPTKCTKLFLTYSVL